MSQAGAVLLVQAMRVIGLGRGLREAPGQWRTPPAVHDPGKIVASTMKLAADDVQTLAVPGCAHWAPEEEGMTPPPWPR